MENTDTHLEPVYEPPRKSSKKILIWFFSFIVLFLAIKVALALNPTAEEIIQQQIEFNGAEWDKWDQMEQSALEVVERAREAKNALHAQTDALRAF